MSNSKQTERFSVAAMLLLLLALCVLAYSILQDSVSCNKLYPDNKELIQKCLYQKNL